VRFVGAKLAHPPSNLGSNMGISMVPTRLVEYQAYIQVLLQHCIVFDDTS